MKEGSELERAAMAAWDSGIISIHEILENLRNEPGIEDTPIFAHLSNRCPAKLAELMQGDVFGSAKELNMVAQVMGLIAMKFAIDHPDDFDLDLLFEEASLGVEEEDLL